MKAVTNESHRNDWALSVTSLQEIEQSKPELAEAVV